MSTNAALHPIGTTSLDEAVAAYEDALRDAMSASSQTADALLRVLIARDQVTRHAASDAIDNARFHRLVSLDQQLRTSAGPLVARLRPATLASWRESWHPEHPPWWWSLETIADDRARAGAWWAVAVALCLSISVSLATDVATRFLRDGPDSLAVFTALSQGMLALLAGSSLTPIGRQWIDRLAAALGVGTPRLRARLDFAIALMVLLVIVALRLSLPRIARLYNDHGARMQALGRTAAAADAYRRALSLDPDFAQPFYNLATVHEDLLDVDEAIKRYRQSIALDDRMYAAYNNLARLYVARKANPGAAISLITRALDMKPAERHVQYSLYKNLGWAWLGNARFAPAERDLKHALELRPDGGAAHCLLAQVLDAVRREHEAIREYELCIAYGSGQAGEVDPDWIALAQQRLSVESR
jgi:tetratricopeptide (TPR) repeat protein